MNPYKANKVLVLLPCKEAKDRALDHLSSIGVRNRQGSHLDYYKDPHEKV